MKSRLNAWSFKCLSVQILYSIDILETRENKTNLAVYYKQSERYTVN